MSEDVTVLIANLGRPENLTACLASVVGPAKGDASLRLIVGFNFSGQSDTPRVLAQQFPDVEQVRAPIQMGYCRAYNQLMARASGRYFLLLDDDTLLGPEAIAGMVRFMDDHPEVGLAGCRTVNRDGTYQKSTGRMFTLWTELLNAFRPATFWQDGIDANVQSWRDVDWLNGHFLFLRASAFAQVGGFDEFYFTVQSEPDWCLQIRRAGWKIAYVPSVEVMHVGGDHSVMTAVKSRANILRSHINRYYFMRKNYGALSMQLLRPLMTGGAALRLLMYVAVWLLRRDRRPEAVPKLAAYWQVIRLGFAARPDRLPDDLARAYASWASFETVA